jgi:hypothetical protein
MNTTPQLDPKVRLDTDPTHRKVARSTAVTDFQYQQPGNVSATTGTTAPTKKALPQLTTFRALSREVFGAAAGREYALELILFVWMMVVAAWPLGVTLNQLGTMYISPPNALW